MRAILFTGTDSLPTEATISPYGTSVRIQGLSSLAASRIEAPESLLQRDQVKVVTLPELAPF